MNRRLMTGLILGAAMMAPQVGLADGHPAAAKTQDRLEEKVRRELVTLPYYSLFDHFAFRVDGSTVTLFGKVSHAPLKADAEHVVKRVEGVESVSNQIEILPVSPHDDRLRMSLYRSIYGHPVLQTLAIRAVPPIHIIVENGNVTLEGVVATAMEKQVANMQANSVAGVFKVTNNLRVESKS